MIIKVLSIILIFLSYSVSLPGNPENDEDRLKNSDCYIYVSVSKEKKIVIYKLDPDREVLNFIGDHNLAGEPGSLCADKSRKRIYAALRDSKSVAAMKIDKKTGITKHLKDTPVAENPVYISTDKKGKYLLITSYSGNKTAVYPVEKGGVNNSPVQVLDARVKPHMINTDPSGKYVFVPNLGGDVVQQFVLQKNGKLQQSNPDGITVKKGSGPRHFTFHPFLDIMYVVNELSCTVMVLKFDRGNGTLSWPFQEISTLPADFTLKNTCADIHVTPDGKFIFASNRGHDSLAGYSADPKTGELKSTGYSPTEKTPREFVIDPSGRFIISAGEGSGNIALYRIQQNGSLLLLKTYEVGKWPVWVMGLVI